MDIDTSAPAVARGEIEVAASPETIWDILTDIWEWPSWNPDVKSASLEGPLAKGTKVRWKPGPGTITSTLRSVEPPHLIAWTGTTFGIKAKHVYRLERRDDATIVKSEESWDGLLVRLLRRSMARRSGRASSQASRGSTPSEPTLGFGAAAARPAPKPTGIPSRTRRPSATARSWRRSKRGPDG
jgi:hypothetical protein